MNAWCVCGNLGHDPRLRHLPSGKPVLNLSVGVSERELMDGEWTNTTLWVDVTLFGQRAEGLAKILSKGMKVAARGRARRREYTARDGTAKWSLEMLADDVEPLEAPRTADSERARPQHRDQLAQHGTRPGTRAYDPGPGFGADDDIPF